MPKRIGGIRDMSAQHVRLQYPDLHGVNRGRDIPGGVFEQAHDDGFAFCQAIMTVDLRHNVVSGFEHGFQDVIAKADLDTLVACPWDATTAWVMCDLYDAHGKPFAGDSRAAVRAAMAAYAKLGYVPIVGPELEYYILEPDGEGGYHAYDQVNTPVYTVGDRADPDGLMREMVDACLAAGLEPLAANHEYGRSQYEINVRHADALTAADRAFRLKSVVKDLAARQGLMATFMGKPFTDDEGSGLHLHVSLATEDGANAFADPKGVEGLADVARHFAAGVLAHAPALTALLLPTVNAYRRLTMESLAPTHVNWGYDNRLTALRFPHYRGAATRAELRLGDGSANIHLAIAAMLFAGLDGIERKLEPPAPIAGLPYELPEEQWGEAIPATFEAALEELERDAMLVESLGGTEPGGIVSTFLAIKRHELERWNAHLSAVTTWELDEYGHHL